VTDFFVSYSRDERGALNNCQSAGSRGFDVWWDPECCRASNTRRNLQGPDDAKAVLVVWSNASTRCLGCMDEAAVGATGGVLVPVLIEKISAVWASAQMQAEDLSDWPHGAITTISNVS